MLKRALAALLVVAGAAAAQPASAPAPPDPLLGSGRGLDHVLVWTRNRDGATAALAVKLGFQVRPGGDFGDGIANRLVQFSDQTFLELLFFTRPAAELQGDALAAWRFTESGTGANNFALEVGDVESTGAHLRGRGWALFPETPTTYDPDGDGPRPAEDSLWRTVAFQSPPLASSDLFFIRYRPFDRTPQQQADGEVFARHPNGARRISAVWLLAADAAEEAGRLRRVGFIETEAVNLPNYNARARRFAAGQGSILVVEAAGPGLAAEALSARGPHIFAISIEVDDLERARRIVRRGYGGTIEAYEGPLGPSFTAPTQSDLGLALEFHTGRQAEDQEGVTQ